MVLFCRIGSSVLCCLFSWLVFIIKFNNISLLFANHYYYYDYNVQFFCLLSIIRPAFVRCSFTTSHPFSHSTCFQFSFFVTVLWVLATSLYRSRAIYGWRWVATSKCGLWGEGGFGWFFFSPQPIPHCLHNTGNIKSTWHYLIHLLSFYSPTRVFWLVCGWFCPIVMSFVCRFNYANTDV